MQVYVPPFWSCFLDFILVYRAEISLFEQTTKFIPVTKPARLLGSYEEALRSDFFWFAFLGDAIKIFLFLFVSIIYNASRFRVAMHLFSERPEKAFAYTPA